jgi:O-antigen ligase
MHVLGFLAVFAGTLHVLLTVEVGGTQLRVGASDLLLPVLGLMLAVSWWRRRDPGPAWHVRHLPLWFLAMLCWFGLSVWRGWGHADPAGSWALLKFAGFIALLGYFLAGGLVAARWGADAAALLCRAYVLVAWSIAAYALARYALAADGLYPSHWYPRLQAFAENPNTYGLLAASAWLLQMAWLRGDPVIGGRWDRLGSTLLLAAVLLSASRSVYLGMALASAVLLWRGWIQPAAALRSAATAVLLLGVLLVAAPGLLENDWDSGLFIVKRDYMDSGVISRASRAQLARDAFAMWLDNPLRGAGVGGFMRAQLAAHGGAAASTNHNSLLWWLSEMGLVGALLFGGFLLAAINKLYRLAAVDRRSAGVLGVTLLLAGASLGTEVMYQRYAWFFLGLALSRKAGVDDEQAVAPRDAGRGA